MATETRREIRIRVMNGSKKRFIDSFEGIVYNFAPETTIAIPEAAAEHIFGYSRAHGEEGSALMFQHTCKRWGWNTHENVVENYETYTDEKGKKHIGPKDYWSKFDFVPVAVKYTEVPIIDTSSLAEPRDRDENMAATA